ncbi:MAG: hypothetical protein IT370_35645 [Deltaproteobacteria bacterium]|nr:hypothetical protein [Deltaproteobacteria bacterium]
MRARASRWLGWCAALVVAAVGGCRREAPRAEVQLWHTFDPAEAATLGRALAGAPVRAATRAVAFERAQNVLRAALERGGDECPDVARVDAAWIPGLARRGLLAEAPPELLSGAAVEPAAAALAEYEGRRYGVAQTFGCLAVIERGGGGAGVALQSLDQLGERLVGGCVAADADGGPRCEVALEADGFWALPWIFAEGGALVDPAARTVSIDEAPAQRALGRLAALARGRALAGDPVAALARGELPLVVEGPWVLGRLGGSEVRVTAFPAAPDGQPSAPVVGQIWVVGRCSRAPTRAWRLIEHLVSAPVAARFARETFAPPALVAARGEAPAVVQAFVTACPARTLPRHEISSALFDDLTPAVGAVLRGEATPTEAMVDVARGWRRRLAALEAP